MAKDSELTRIARNGVDEAPAAGWEFLIDLGIDADATWNRIVGVVTEIVGFDYDSWPDEVYWRNQLPDWLVGFMLTLEECDALTERTPRDQWHTLQWEFGSWLDAIRERDWRWWGQVRADNRVRIVLEVTGIPPRIDAFKQILLAAGARILSEEF